MLWKSVQYMFIITEHISLHLAVHVTLIAGIKYENNERTEQFYRKFNGILLLLELKWQDK